MNVSSSRQIGSVLGVYNLGRSGQDSIQFGSNAKVYRIVKGDLGKRSLHSLACTWSPGTIRYRVQDGKKYKLSVPAGSVE